jgi:Mg2+/Co2+ transporter CorC
VVVNSIDHPNLISCALFFWCFRVPVFEERIDNIVGIAYAMDMLEHVEQVLYLIVCFQNLCLFLLFV